MAKILFVEDEQFLMEGLIFELADNQHEVMVVGDGETAIRRLEKGRHNFELIILDVMLPAGEPNGKPTIDKNVKTDEMGLEILRQLRENMLDQTPVIVLTAAIDDDLKARIMSYGVERYFTKPTSLPVLIEAVHDILRD